MDSEQYCPLTINFVVHSKCNEGSNLLQIISKDSDQPGQVPRMIRVIAGDISILVGFVRHQFIKLLHVVY